MDPGVSAVMSFMVVMVEVTFIICVIFIFLSKWKMEECGWDLNDFLHSNWSMATTMVIFFAFIPLMLALLFLIMVGPYFY